MLLFKSKWGKRIAVIWTQWVTYASGPVWMGKMSGGSGEQKARVMGSSNTLKKELPRWSPSLMWGLWKDRWLCWGWDCHGVGVWLWLLTACPVTLQSFRRQPEKQTMLLASAKLMAKEVGASAVGEVTPGGHCVDVGAWSLGRLEF